MLKGYLQEKNKPVHPERHAIRKSITLGRAVDCDIMIDDLSVSRYHLQIFEKNGQYYWKDLGTTNGSFINGSNLLEGRLKDGDEIRVGHTVFLFETDDVSENDNKTFEQTLFNQTIVDQFTGEVDKSEPGKPDQLLSAVYSVINTIATNYEPCSLIDQILETTMKAIDAQRGTILFAGQSVDELLPCQVCRSIHMIEDGSIRHVENGEISISSSVFRRVLLDGESVIYQDFDGASEFSAAESIVALKLRSILCAPIRGKSGIMGILYIDSDRAGHHYTHDHMLLLTAIGNSAGLALENARMHKQILEKQRMDQEVQHAWTIQQGFLVKQWRTSDPRFRVFGATQPAKIVGGDFYDFVTPSEDRVGLLIGDVSGKGVPAALTMAQILAEFRILAQQIDSPAEVLKRINSNFAKRSQRGMYCTMCFLILNLKDGKALCANAGHNDCIRISRQLIERVVNASGPPIGILSSLEWEDKEIQIEPGDTLLLITDGILEARKERTAVKKDETGYNNYNIDSFFGANPRLHEKQPREMIQLLLEDVASFCAPSLPHDDCTLLALQYQG